MSAITNQQWQINLSCQKRRILAFACRVDWRRGKEWKLVGRNVRWRLLLLLDAHDDLFQRSVVRDSIHSENMLYANACADADTTSANADTTPANADTTLADADTTSTNADPNSAPTETDSYAQTRSNSPPTITPHSDSQQLPLCTSTATHSFCYYSTNGDSNTHIKSDSDTNTNS
jgi:hypothetical protein